MKFVVHIKGKIEIEAPTPNEAIGTVKRLMFTKRLAIGLDPGQVSAVITHTSEA